MPTVGHSPDPSDSPVPCEERVQGWWREHSVPVSIGQWEREYNEWRSHMTLQGETPKEYLTEKLRNHVSR